MPAGRACSPRCPSSRTSSPAGRDEPRPTCDRHHPRRRTAHHPRRDTMRATLMYGASDVRVDDVPDSAIKHPTDALVRITASCICGSDLHPYHSMPTDNGPARMGHEFIGVVEATGSEVTTVKKG